MVRDHKAVNEQALALLKKLKVKPEDNAISRALNQLAEAKLNELQALKGAAFDMAYAVLDGPLPGTWVLARPKRAPALAAKSIL